MEFTFCAPVFQGRDPEYSGNHSGLHSLSEAETAFRCLKTLGLQIRPIYHRLTDRVRAHAFVCMLAYYVEWHMRQPWPP